MKWRIFPLRVLSFQNGCTMRCVILNPVFNSPVNHWPHVAVGCPEWCFTRLPPDVWSFVHKTRREGVIQFKTKRKKWWFFLGVLCYTSWHWKLHIIAQNIKPKAEEHGTLLRRPDCTLPSPTVRLWTYLSHKTENCEWKTRSRQLYAIVNAMKCNTEHLRKIIIFPSLF